MKGLRLLAMGLLWVSLASCKSTPGTEEARKMLVGSYLLDQETAANAKVTSSLVLRSDGTMSQLCKAANGEIRRADGRWTYPVGSSPNILLEPFVDCAGVFPDDHRGRDSSLIVEFNGGSPLILVNPDLDAFYSKVPDDARQ